MPMPPGGWASALGAAILGGQQAYQTQKKSEMENRLEALHLALTQDQVNELPHKHAEDDIASIHNVLGDAAVNSPAYVKAVNTAFPSTLQTKNIPQAQVQDIESGAGAPALSTAQMATKLGVAPDTGVVIPPSILLQQRQDAQKLAQNDMVTRYLQGQLGGGPGAVPGAPATNAPPATPITVANVGNEIPLEPNPKPMDDPAFPQGVQDYIAQLQTKHPGDNQAVQTELQGAWPSIVKAHPQVDVTKVMASLPVTAAPVDPAAAPAAPATPGIGPEPPFENPKAKAARVMDKLTGLDAGETQRESTEHKVYTANAEAVAKSAFRPPQAAVQKELDAYTKARIIIPQLREALMKEVLDPNDPTGQNANPMMMAGHMAKQWVKSEAYSNGWPLSDNDAKAQQLAGLLKVVGATPYLNGSRSVQMFNQVADHLTDRKMTPEAQLQRLNELDAVFPEFEQAIGFKAPGGKAPSPLAGGAAAQVQPPMSTRPSLSVSGLSATPPVDAAASAPVNKNRTLTDVKNLMAVTGKSQKSIIQAVQAAGGSVDMTK